MKGGRPVLLICESDWGQTRAAALRLGAEGVPSVALVRISPGSELQELIRMIPPHPMIRQHFISKKIFRAALVLGLPFWLGALRTPTVRCDKERTFRSLSPWLQWLGIPCDRMGN